MAFDVVATKAGIFAAGGRCMLKVTSLRKSIIESVSLPAKFTSCRIIQLQVDWRPVGSPCPSLLLAGDLMDPRPNSSDEPYHSRLD